MQHAINSKGTHKAAGSLHSVVLWPVEALYQKNHIIQNHVKTQPENAPDFTDWTKRCSEQL